MKKIREQLGEITKNLRTKNNLTQEDMASKLYLSSKQSIYYYEKGQRIMKLPEFIEFIQDFNETVVINENGISLLDDIIDNNYSNNIIDNDYSNNEEQFQPFHFTRTRPNFWHLENVDDIINRMIKNPENKLEDKNISLK